jgi:ABC-type antimicrobial peptide transport system permease subunit
VLVNRLREIPGIVNVSLAGSSPASSSTSTSHMKVNNGTRVIETMVEIKQADTNYFNLFGMKLVAGRNLLQSDTTKEYVINETYAKFLGFQQPEDALGHFIERNTSLPIVGVLADFHTKSTHLGIKPLAFSMFTKWSFTVHMALNPADPSSWKTTLAKAEFLFKEMYPDDDFNPKFFDQTIAGFYKTEQNTARLLNWAAGLAVFISCLGLLGLVIHTTNARTKEIGVRKVLGASISGIVTLLSTEFLSLVLVAFALAAPVGWWVMKGWLEDFAYRTSLSWWVFVLAGTLAIVTALVTVSVQAFRAASANPVDSLRAE